MGNGAYPALCPADVAFAVREFRRVQRELDVAVDGLCCFPARTREGSFLWIYGGASAGHDDWQLLRLSNVQLHDDWAYLRQMLRQSLPRAISFARDKRNPRVSFSLRDNDSLFIYVRAANRLGTVYEVRLLADGYNASCPCLSRAQIGFGVK